MHPTTNASTVFRPASVLPRNRSLKVELPISVSLSRPKKPRSCAAAAIWRYDGLPKSAWS